MINEHDLEAMAPGFLENEKDFSRSNVQMTSYKDFIKMLEDSLAYCKEADDAGSVDHCMAQWQAMIKQWPPIYDENGGL